MTLTTAKWTLDDYHQMIASGILDHRRVELLSGEIVEMAPEGPEHAYLGDETGKYLGALLGDRARVREGWPITLAPNSEPEPDIAVVRSLGEVYRHRHPYAEDSFWVIEFSNTNLAKDLKPKRQLYASAEIPEYWVVNLRARLLVVLRDPREGDYRQEEKLSQGTVAPLAFPEVALSVSRLLGL